MSTLLETIVADAQHGSPCSCPRCRARRQNAEIIHDPIERRLRKRKDQRRRISRTTGTPFRYICAFEYNGRAFGCTGTLIGPRTALTAGHCVWDRWKNRKIDLSKVSIRLYPGRNGKTSPFGSALVKKIITFPGFNNSRIGEAEDLAVVHLDRPIGKKVGFWGLDHRTYSHDPRGVSILKGALPFLPGSGRLRVNLSGYPHDKPAGCVRGTCGTQQWWTFNHVVQRSAGVLHYFNDTKRGHSGSPVWIKRSKWKGGRVMVAVHVDKDHREDKVRANRGVFLDQQKRAFIAKHLK